MLPSPPPPGPIKMPSFFYHVKNMVKSVKMVCVNGSFYTLPSGKDIVTLVALRTNESLRLGGGRKGYPGGGPGAGRAAVSSLWTQLTSARTEAKARMPVALTRDGWPAVSAQEMFAVFLL